MKMKKYLLPVFLCLLLFFSALLLGSQNNHVEKAIEQELDLLENLDSETTGKYFANTELFPDTRQNPEFSEEMQQVFSLFFKDFDYKIQKINVDKKNNKATAKLRLKTPDTHALAKDYSLALLKFSILSAAESESTNDFLPSLEARYQLLNQQLSTNTYKTIPTDCTIQLTRANRASDIWEIKRTNTLENDLIGGLMTALAENDILSPEETLCVYLDTLEEMNFKQMSNYLGISSLLHSDDKQKENIASALVEQVHKHFRYEITDTKIMDACKAEVKVKITSFDSISILSAYQDELDAYLATTEAVIDGSGVRMQKAYDMLLKYIQESTSTMEHEATFHLVNDGISWKLTDGSEELGNAIFGSLTTTPLEEEH